MKTLFIFLFSFGLLQNCFSQYEDEVPDYIISVTLKSGKIKYSTEIENFSLNLFQKEIADCEVEEQYAGYEFSMHFYELSKEILQLYASKSLFSIEIEVKDRITGKLVKEIKIDKAWFHTFGYFFTNYKTKEKGDELGDVFVYFKEITIDGVKIVY